MNVDRRPLLQLGLMNFKLQNFQLYNKSLKDWSLGKQLILFPSNLKCFPRRNIEILGKQNKLFPEGSAIKCFVLRDCYADQMIRHSNSGMCGRNPMMIPF